VAIFFAAPPYFITQQHSAAALLATGKYESRGIQPFDSWRVSRFWVILYRNSLVLEVLTVRFTGASSKALGGDHKTGISSSL
jgi:hypothetical protein